MSESVPVIEAVDLSKTYKQGKLEVHALRGVDLSVEPGDFTVLAGPSGSGKTTLLNLVGLLDKPTQGRLRLDGTEMTALSAAERAKVRRDRIGFVFQAYNLLPVLSARENTELVLLLQGVGPSERTERAQRVLRSVGLGTMMDRRPDELSGGQQQRVAVARAIASGPSLVLADEPTANLDSKSAESLLDLMSELNTEQKISFLFSSHDPRVIARARRVVYIEDGRVRSSSKPAERRTA